MIKRATWVHTKPPLAREESTHTIQKACISIQRISIIEVAPLPTAGILTGLIPGCDTVAIGNDPQINQSENDVHTVLSTHPQGWVNQDHHRRADTNPSNPIPLIPESKVPRSVNPPTRPWFLKGVFDIRGNGLIETTNEKSRHLLSPISAGWFRIPRCSNFCWASCKGDSSAEGPRCPSSGLQPPLSWPWQLFFHWLHLVGGVWTSKHLDKPTENGGF